jgi:hypothetical protein
MKYISNKDAASTVEMLEDAEKFWKQVKVMIPKAYPHYVINTDQTGCQYQSKIGRTLGHKWLKTAFLKGIAWTKSRTRIWQSMQLLCQEIRFHLFFVSARTNKQIWSSCTKESDVLPRLAARSLSDELRASRLSSVWNRHPCWCCPDVILFQWLLLLCGPCILLSWLVCRCYCIS